MRGSEWGLLKTTAVTWDHGWAPSAHKVPPKEYWGNRSIEVHQGDVIITKAGPRHRVGVVAHIDSTPPQLMVSGKMVLLRPDLRRVNPKVLALALATPVAQKYLDDRTTGMAESQVNFANEALLGCPLQLPPLAEQRRIAEIVDAIDEAIQTSERLIEKLRDLRRSIQQATFGRATWSTEYETVRLGTLLAEPPKNGHSPVEANSWTGAWLLGLGCLTEDGFLPRQLKFAPEVDARLSAARLSDGDLLISRSNTRELVGLVGRYADTGAPAFYPDLMMRLTPSGEVTAEFLEAALRAGPARRQIMAIASGTSGSMVKITGAGVTNLLVPRLPARDQERAVRPLAAVSTRIEAESAVSMKLRSVRSGLATDLLSGYVRNAGS